MIGHLVFFSMLGIKLVCHLGHLLETFHFEAHLPEEE